jgi:hypothetical protein
VNVHPVEEFDFLGYTFGQRHAAKTRRPYTRGRPMQHGKPHAWSSASINRKPVTDSLGAMGCRKGPQYMRRFILGWKLTGAEQRLGAQIVNYADDLVICCKGNNAVRALETMRRMHAVANIRRNRRVLFRSFPHDGSLPRFLGGSASALRLSTPAQRSLTLRPAYSPSHLHDPLHRRLQPRRYLRDCSDCYRLERKLPGGIRTH